MPNRYSYILVLAAAVAASTAAVSTVAVQDRGPVLDDVVARMARYVSGYGEQASLIVSVEKYRQLVSIDGARMRPRQLTAEFVIVRTDTAVGWIGFRDVTEVDGKDVNERRDRLETLLIGKSVDAFAVTKIADESSRFNVGPTIRNFNVPTTALFFFHPANVGRFTYRKIGSSSVAGRAVWEIGFTETTRPTLIMKRDGTDVPCEGTVWVSEADGTVIRTRLQLRHFADQKQLLEVAVQEPPPPRPAPPPPPPPPTPTTGAGGVPVPAPPPATPPPQPPPVRRQTSRELVEMQSLADIDVTYERVERLGLWLPSRMKEVYEGPMVLMAGANPRLGRATTEARYSDFKQFTSTAKITFPK